MSRSELLGLASGAAFLGFLYHVLFVEAKGIKHIQQSPPDAVSYVCTRQGVEYIRFDWRVMVLSVDQDGKPVKCHHE